MQTIIEAEKEIKIAGNYDVIVCGGGPAGVAAALSSARSGAKTLLLEVNGCLGGIWTAGLMPWIIDHNNKTGIMKEFREDLMADGSANIPPHSGSLACDVEIMKLYLEQKCLEAGIDILLHSRVVGTINNDQKITQVITESKSGREAWSAKVFVDATGDGDLSAFAGCEFDFANEEGLTQPMSMIALLCGIKLEEVAPYINGHHSGEWGVGKKRLKDEMLGAGVNPSYAHPTIFHLKDGLFVMMANHEYKVSAVNTADVTKATLASRQEVHQLVNALKSRGGVWKDLQLAATSEQIGTREGRRIKGLYELKSEDMINGTEFEDATCKCNFGIDVHSPDPDKAKGMAPQNQNS